MTNVSDRALDYYDEIIVDLERLHLRVLIGTGSCDGRVSGDPELESLAGLRSLRLRPNLTSLGNFLTSDLLDGTAYLTERLFTLQAVRQLQTTKEDQFASQLQRSSPSQSCYGKSPRTKNSRPHRGLEIKVYSSQRMRRLPNSSAELKSVTRQPRQIGQHGLCRQVTQLCHEVRKEWGYQSR